MEQFYAIALAFMETTFLFVALLLLHGARRSIGAASCWIAIGLLFVFSQIADAAGLTVSTPWFGCDVRMSQCILTIPLMAFLVLLYITEGVLATQRLVIALIVAFGIYLYLALTTGTQTDEAFPLLAGNELTAPLSTLLYGSVVRMAAHVVGFSAAIFLIPVAYQTLKNAGLSSFSSILVSLLIASFLENVLFYAVFEWGRPDWWRGPASGCLANTIVAIWISALLAFYLKRMRREAPFGEGRSPLDVFLAFTGNYRRARELERTLQETEERYRLLFRYAGDGILVVRPSGVVVDANNAALALLGKTSAATIGGSFPELFGVSLRAWDDMALQSFSRCSGMIPGTDRTVETTLSRMDVAGEPMILAYAHDVTQQIRLEREREEWRTQAFHRQRLESIGRLAGGIAHDFNNFLHAIQGRLDIIRYMHPVQDPDAKRHLEGIDAITQKAAALTKQLLGFARKGNYAASRMELIPFLKSAIDLFLPSAAGITVELRTETKLGENAAVCADCFQLQQVLLNLLVNARDAMDAAGVTDRRIIVSLGTAEELGLKPSPPPDAAPDAKARHCAISLRDNGTGVDPAIKGRIFEPFFTTKPVGQGTGMGLSMAYGIATAHKGWIQYDPPASGPGAIFSIFLPIAEGTPSETAKERQQ